MRCWRRTLLLRLAVAHPCMEAMQYRASEIAWSIEDFTRRFQDLGTQILIAMEPPRGGIITD